MLLTFTNYSKELRDVVFFTIENYHIVEKIVTLRTNI
jgi:hypothetical protein